MSNSNFKFKFKFQISNYNYKLQYQIHIPNSYYNSNYSDVCAELLSTGVKGGRAEGQACADPGARTPIGTSGNYLKLIFHIKQSFNQEHQYELKIHISLTQEQQYELKQQYIL